MTVQQRVLLQNRLWVSSSYENKGIERAVRKPGFAAFPWKQAVDFGLLAAYAAHGTTGTIPRCFPGRMFPALRQKPRKTSRNSYNRPFRVFLLVFVVSPPAKSNLETFPISSFYHDLFSVIPFSFHVISREKSNTS